MFSAGQKIEARDKLFGHELELAREVSHALDQVTSVNLELLELAQPETWAPITDKLFTAAPTIFTDLPRIEAPSALRGEVLNDALDHETLFTPVPDDVVPIADPDLVDVSQPRGDLENELKMCFANDTQLEPIRQECDELIKLLFEIREREPGHYYRLSRKIADVEVLREQNDLLAQLSPGDLTEMLRPFVEGFTVKGP